MPNETFLDKVMRIGSELLTQVQTDVEAAVKESTQQPSKTQHTRSYPVVPTPPAPQKVQVKVSSPSSTPTAPAKVPPKTVATPQPVPPSWSPNPQTKAQQPPVQQGTVSPPKMDSPVQTPDPIPSTTADSAFVIGGGHDVCQDYAVSDTNLARAYAVIADGCSGSKHTDIGSRILVKMFERYIPKTGHTDLKAYSNRAEQTLRKVIGDAWDYAQGLSLNEEALDATLIAAQTDSKGNFVVTLYGDGAVALGRRDGMIEVYSTSFQASYPRYLSYLISPARTEAYEKITGNQKRITFQLIAGKDSSSQSYESGTRMDCFLGNRSQYKWVAALSDGIQSFSRWVESDTGRYQEPIPMEQVLVRLLDFKGTFTGSFTKRRLNKFLHDCKKWDWLHHDDLAMGVIYLGEDE